MGTIPLNRQRIPEERKSIDMNLDQKRIPNQNRKLLNFRPERVLVDQAVDRFLATVDQSTARQSPKTCVCKYT